MAAAVEVAGVMRPALVFGGLGVHGETLPRYLLAGGAEDLRRTAGLVSAQAEAAIRAVAGGHGRG